MHGKTELTIFWTILISWETFAKTKQLQWLVDIEWIMIIQKWLSMLTLIVIHENDSYKMIHANLTDIGYKCLNHKQNWLLQWKLTIEVQAYLIKLFQISIKWLISLSDIAFILDVPIFSMENNERPKWKR